MPLHPQAAEFLQKYYATNPAPRDAVPPEVSRREMLATSIIPPDCPRPARTEDRLLKGPAGDVRVRIHTPAGAGPFGACLYFHGGGWVLGAIETHDDLVRRLAVAANCVMINVDYRLAPEHKYPAAIDDGYFALRWVAEHAGELNIDPRRIAVAGDSAGGNIAAALCLMSRDRNGPRIAYQLLIYPIVDCDFDRPSYLANAEGYFLTRRVMQWFWKQYAARPEQMSEAYASPLKAKSLAGLPPAYVLTAGYDPLFDEGRDYAAALKQAGVPTEYREFPGMIHGFVKRWTEFDDARTATRELGEALRQAIGTGGT